MAAGFSKRSSAGQGYGKDGEDLLDSFSGLRPRSSDLRRKKKHQAEKPRLGADDLDLISGMNSGRLQ